MANVQKQFEEFHGRIRIDFEMSEPLREKRDILVNKIRDSLKAAQRPLCSPYGQGSYSMGTGVVPLGTRYDIDTGLMFPISETDHTAAEVREWVWEAVKDHTDNVVNKGPCVRVIYSDGFHVDLVSYARWKNANGTENFRLAHRTAGWRDADPPRLREHIETARKRFADLTDDATSTDQFRRCVRYLRRWIDVQIPGDASGKPTGLGMVLLCCQHLVPKRDLRGPDDRMALEHIASTLSNMSGRIVAQKPTPEYEDLFAGFSESEMTKLKSLFGDLAKALYEAGAEPDPAKACKKLASVFGEDFKGPSPEEAARRSSAPAIISTSTSG
jgi:hypothetical protein